MNRSILSGTSRACFVIAGAALSLIVQTAHAVPAAIIGRAALIDPSSVATVYPTTNDATHTFTLGTSTPPPEVIELARALGNNPDEIYDFVHNYVDTVFMFGAQKGAIGAIVDKSGTPFDQAELMVSLLRQAGYTTASYKFGTIILTGTQFAAWTNINNAQAACDILASGGIPASINGSSASAQCSTFSSVTAISTVKMEHIWVDVVIDGTHYLFDPSYKIYDFSPQLNLAAAAGLSSGGAFNAATTGLTATSTSGVNYVQNLNAGSLSTTLTGYATNLQNFIQTGTYTPVNPVLGQPTPAPLVSARIINLVGGREIRHDQVPIAGLRQTSLPYQDTGSTPRSWSGSIPDQFRTKLNVNITQCVPVTDAGGNVTISCPPIVNKDIYTDDIYGRRLLFNPRFISHGTGLLATLDVVDEFAGGQNLVTINDTTSVPTLSVGTVTLTLNHPYAADAIVGSTSATGTYMDTVFSRYLRYDTPFTIVYGFGEANKGLIDKWGRMGDSALPLPPPNGCEICPTTYRNTTGDGRRQQLASAWLVQSSKAARLHASIANSIYTHHHSIGVVSGDTVISTVDTTPNGPTRTYNYSVQESFDRVDIESGYSVTSLTENAADRRAAIHAIAATLDALEGSVNAQISDLPDTVSTATRFEWGNAPPPTEDPSGHGARRFYDFNSTNIGTAGANINSLLLVEGVHATSSSGQHGAGTSSNPDPVIIGSGETNSRESATSSLIFNYAQFSGWDVVASEEAFLGPGQRGGAFNSTGIGNTYTHNFTEQRGGAFVATLYNNGDPVQIAHIAANVNPGSPNQTDGITSGIKGGGGGAQPNHNSLYDPSTAADILKSQFVDRSKAIGVDLDSGAITYTSPASLKVGNGDFPFSLTASLIWRGGHQNQNIFGPVSHIAPNTPFTTNWNNTLTISGSALEAMGETDIRATAGTVAAFMAMQDIYRQSVMPQREVAALLASSWWLHQITGNVATVNVGADTRQFLRRYDKSWFKPGAGEFTSLQQTGERAVYVQTDCTGATGYTTTRGWDYSPVTYTVTNTHGDQQNFSFWNTTYQDTNQKFCAFLHGFRMSTWTFPYGMTVSLTYQPPAAGLLDDLVQVSNSFGRVINFVDNGLGGFNNGLSGADARSVQVTPDPIAVTSTSVTHTDPAGVQTQINFTLTGGGWRLSQVLASVGPMSSPPAPTTPMLQYTYDTLGRVQTAQDATGLQNNDPTRIYNFYFAEGARADRIAPSIDPSGADYTVVNDIYRLPHWFVDELEHTTTVTHDGRGRVLSYEFPEKNQELYTYDDHNNTTGLIRKAKPGSLIADIPVSATWDQTWNKPLSITDARGCITTFAYNTANPGKSLLQNATRCKPDSTQANPVYAFTYNGVGQPLQMTDPTNLVTLNTYEPGNTGNLMSTAVDPSGVNSIVSYTYYPGGLVKAVTDPRLYVTEQRYDLDDRNILTLHHDGSIGDVLLASERNTFDTLGRITQKEGGTGFSGVTTTTWQTLSTSTYTLTGKLLTQADPAQNITRYFYDPMDRLQMVKDPVGRRVATVFDLAGQTLYTWRGWDSDTVFPSAGTVWNPSSYTGTGRIRYAAYTYSQNGKPIQVQDANNNVTQLAYDGHDRLSLTLFADPVAGTVCSFASSPTTGYEGVAPTCVAHQTYEKYAYNLDGTQSSIRKRDGQVINFTYDALGREVVKDLPGTTSGDVYYGYDLAGRPSFALFGSANAVGNGVEYGYDTAKRLTSEKTFSRSVGYGYDPSNNRNKITWPDTNFIIYQFDGLNRAFQVGENGATSGAGLLATYGYDPLSHRTSITRNNGANTGFGYDTDLRLNSIAHDVNGTAKDLTLSFSYTLASQLQQRSSSNSLYTWIPVADTKTYVPDALNRYATVTNSAGTATYNYDDRGNLTSDGTTRGFAYDVENHLLTVTGGPGLTLSYDPLGRLWQTVSAGAITQFLYAGDSLIGEYSTTGTVLRRYAHGPGTDEPIVWYEGSDLTVRRWLLADERGSIVARTDGAGVATEYSYGPYGEPSTWAGPRFAYTGQIALPEAQLYHYKARVYDPSLGRFLQTDPVGTKDDFNLYAYVHGDPINGGDPTGLTEDKFDNGEDSCGTRLKGAAANCTSAVTVEKGGGKKDTPVAVNIGAPGVPVTVQMPQSQADAFEEGVDEAKTAGLAAAAALSGVGDLAAAGEVGGKQVIEAVARKEYGKGLDYLKGFMSPGQLRLLKDPRTAPMAIGTAVHNATWAALREQFPGRFQYFATRGMDFLDKATGEFIELTTKAQQAYKEWKYGVDAGSIATY